jgi:hypothetical protein
MGAALRNGKWVAKCLPEPAHHRMGAGQQLKTASGCQRQCCFKVRADPFDIGKSGGLVRTSAVIAD